MQQLVREIRGALKGDRRHLVETAGKDMERFLTGEPPPPPRSMEEDEEMV